MSRAICIRIAGEQADAIGKEVVRPPQLPPNATEEDVRELAWEQMRSCYDPGDPDQHRRSGPGVRMRGGRRRRIRRAISASP